jgi:hypothetical protein
MIKLIAPGVPCTCREGRFVRYAVPTVPGLRGFISCRPYESTRYDDVREHDLPREAVIALHVPGVARG